MRVCIVMPVRNEDPGYAAAAVRSMLAQTRLPDRIHVIDDGSTDGGAAADAIESVLARATVSWTVTRLERNQGKRDALALGFLADPTADVFAGHTAFWTSTTVGGPSPAGMTAYEVAGIVNAAVGSLAITDSRGVVHPVAMTSDRGFIYDAPLSDLKAGVQPAKLVTYSASGVQLEQIALR